MAEKLTTRIHRCLHGDTPGEHIDADEAAGLLEEARDRIEELEGALRQANSRIEVLESFVDQASRIRFQMDKLSNEEALELRRQGDVTRVNEGDIICLQIAAAALNIKGQGNG